MSDPAMVGPDGQVVVVGAGVAGLSVAVELRRLGHLGPVMVLDRGEVLHDRPPLSKAYLRGEVDEDGLAPYPPAQLAAQGVEVRTGAAALSLDPGDAQTRAAVSLVDGSTVRAEAVVLAEGGRAHRMPIPGAGLALVLRTLDDARELRRRLRPAVRLVVLGGGLVGAEVAATAASLGARVTLVDPDPLPLSVVVGPEVAQVLLADHARHGVDLAVAAAVAVQGGADGPLRVLLTDGSAAAADVVLLATGMRPVDDLARTAGLDVAPGGGTLVDEAQRTSARRVLAVGDGTCRRRADGSPGSSAGHWDAARLDGLAAAAVLLGREPPSRGAPWFWSDRHGRHVEVVGEVVPAGGNARTVVRGDPGPSPFAVLGWRDGVLTGAVAVDDPLTARAVRRLVDRAVDVDVAALDDPATDLRRLARG